MNILNKLASLFKPEDPSTAYWEMLRLLLGWIFLWAFLDKTFGFGFATPFAKAWINGGSPTYGFLMFGTEGNLFHQYFQPMAGHLLVDLLFMGGLLGVGVSLLLGVALRVAGYSGALMMTFIYLASLPLKQNPFIDEHIIYIIVLLAMTRVNVGTVYSITSWWKSTDIVKKYPFLA